MAAYVKLGDATILPSSPEDTGSCQVQKITHKDIIALGHEIYLQSANEAENNLRSSLQLLRRQLHEQSVLEKTEAVEITQSKAEQQLRKALEDAGKKQEKAVRAESKRVEAMMKKLATQQVEEERIRGEERLQKALSETRKQFNLDIIAALERCSSEERLKSEEQVLLLKKEQELQLGELRSLMLQEKEDALRNLRLEMEQCKETSMLELEKEKLQEKEHVLSDLRKQHEAEIDNLNKIIQSHGDDKLKLKEDMSQQVNLLRKSEHKIEELMIAFRTFIEQQPGFTEGQSDFLLKGFLPEIICDDR